MKKIDRYNQLFLDLYNIDNPEDIQKNLEEYKIGHVGSCKTVNGISFAKRIEIILSCIKKEKGLEFTNSYLEKNNEGGVNIHNQTECVAYFVLYHNDHSDEKFGIEKFKELLKNAAAILKERGDTESNTIKPKINNTMALLQDVLLKESNSLDTEIERVTQFLTKELETTEENPEFVLFFKTCLPHLVSNHHRSLYYLKKYTLLLILDKLLSFAKSYLEISSIEQISGKESVEKARLITETYFARYYIETDLFDGNIPRKADIIPEMLRIMPIEGSPIPPFYGDLTIDDFHFDQLSDFRNALNYEKIHILLQELLSVPIVNSRFTRQVFGQKTSMSDKMFLLEIINGETNVSRSTLLSVLLYAKSFLNKYRLEEIKSNFEIDFNTQKFLLEKQRINQILQDSGFAILNEDGSDLFSIMLSQEVNDLDDIFVYAWMTEDLKEHKISKVRNSKIVTIDDILKAL